MKFNSKNSNLKTIIDNEKILEQILNRVLILTIIDFNNF